MVAIGSPSLLASSISKASWNAFQLEHRPKIAIHIVLVSRMNAHFEDLAIFDAIRSAGREEEFFVANLAVTHMLLNHGSIVQHSEVHVVNPDAAFEKRAEESDYSVHTFHTGRERVMPGHRPANIWMEDFFLN